MAATETTLPVPDLDGVDVAFGADALSWMPKMEDIPAEFKRWPGTEWNQIVNRWFFSGLPKGTEFVPKPGIDGDAALRAIKATIGSFAPKHEHKEAAAAYMLASWFKKVKGWKA